jgi:hypothetical protein
MSTGDRRWSTAQDRFLAPHTRADGDRDAAAYQPRDARARGGRRRRAGRRRRPLCAEFMATDGLGGPQSREVVAPSERSLFVDAMRASLLRTTRRSRDLLGDDLQGLCGGQIHDGTAFHAQSKAHTASSLSGHDGADVEHASALNGLELTRTALNCAVVTCAEFISAGHGLCRAELAVIRSCTRGDR